MQQVFIVKFFWFHRVDWTFWNFFLVVTLNYKDFLVIKSIIISLIFLLINFWGAQVSIKILENYGEKRAIKVEKVAENSIASSISLKQSEL